MGFFFSGLAVRKGKPHEELKKMIDMLGQSSVHSVVFHEEVDTCVLEFWKLKISYFGEGHFQCK